LVCNISPAHVPDIAGADTLPVALISPATVRRRCSGITPIPILSLK